MKLSRNPKNHLLNMVPVRVKDWFGLALLKGVFHKHPKSVVEYNFLVLLKTLV